MALLTLFPNELSSPRVACLQPATPNLYSSIALLHLTCQALIGAWLSNQVITGIIVRKVSTTKIYILRLSIPAVASTQLSDSTGIHSIWLL